MTLSAPEIFTSVRDELLGEARRSPGLLADLANLERNIAETYSARSLSYSCTTIQNEVKPPKDRINA